MGNHHGPESARPTGKKKAWAVVRLILGLAQMTGAVASLALLLRSGINLLTLGAVFGTCLVTMTSILLFRSRGAQ